METEIVDEPMTGDQAVTAVENLLNKLVKQGQTINHLSLVLNKKNRKINRLRAAIKTLSPKKPDRPIQNLHIPMASPCDC